MIFIVAILCFGCLISSGWSFVGYDDSQSDILVGDMLYTREQWSDRLSRKMADESRFWPRNSDGVIVVPWRIEHPDVDRALFLSALDDWEAKTCVTFKELGTNAHPADGSYLRISMQGGCFSNVGKIRNRHTLVSLEGRACKYVGNVHEIGHALGFQHEQSREDRDPWLVVVPENMSPGTEQQFAKEPTHNYSVPYDYSSIMQYDGRAGAVRGTRVLLATDPRFQTVMGQAEDLSHMDLKLFNTAYGCVDDWVKKCRKSADPCKNLGYLGKDCKCVCPMGTTGTTCQTKQMEYNDAVLEKYSPLNERFTSPGVVTSPSYPQLPSTAQRYVQVFEAPACHRAVITFEAFQITHRHGYSQCYFDTLEIRSDITEANGEIYCGTDIRKGTVFKSQNSMLILHYTGYDYSKQNSKNPNPGYEVKFTTERIPRCSVRRNLPPLFL